MIDPNISIDEAALATARATLEEFERRQDQFPLYIADGCDPLLAVRDIRAHLVRNLNGSQMIALAVIGLDRVLDSLERVEWRLVEARER